MYRRAIRILYRVVPWAGWILTAAAFITFFGVWFDWIATGDARPATLLLSADLFVSGVSTLQQDAEAEEPPAET